MRVRNKNGGFSLIELLIVVAIILIIASIAIPNILRARMQANETSGAANLKLIRDAEATYIILYGGFADTLAKLGPASPCSPAGACLMDGVIGCAAQPCAKGGYMYFMTSSGAAIPPVDFAASSTPVAWASSGQKNFCVTQEGILRQQVTPAGSLAAAVAPSVCGNSSLYVAVH